MNDKYLKLLRQFVPRNNISDVIARSLRRSNLSKGFNFRRITHRCTILIRPTTLLSIFFITAAHAAVLKTSINRNNISPRESFNLTVSGINPNNLTPPDLSSLRQNFFILGTAKNQSLTVLNGKVIQKHQWVITLLPKHTGKLSIPSIKVGQDTSQVLSINVLSSSQIFKTADEPIFIKVSVTPKDAYVQSQINYKVKVYYDINIPAAAIYPPKVENAIVKQLGQDQQYAARIKNKTYRVFERSFLIFPQKPGKLKIKPAVFRANIPAKKQPQAYADFNVLTTKPIQLVAPTIALNVKPIPKAAQNHWWLPTTKLTLSQQWSPVQNAFKVGEPITRKLMIKAIDVLPNQLPQISVNSSNAYNTYLDKALSEQLVENGKLIATRIEKITYLPQQAGTLKLPEITVQWWNVKTHKLETTVLPSKEFTIRANISSSSIEKSITPTVVAPVSSKANAKQTFSFKYFYLLILLPLILIIFILFKKVSNNRKLCLSRQLKKACFANDPHKAQKALLKLFDISDLSKIRLMKKSRHCERSEAISVKKPRDYFVAALLVMTTKKVYRKSYKSALKSEIEKLQRFLYKEDSHVWDGKALWKTFVNFRKNQKLKEDKKIDDVLPPLNPR